MTNSIIQFDYSDNKHCASIYVRANAYKKEYIFLFENICSTIDKNEELQEGRLNWENMVLEIIVRIAKWINRPDGIKLISKIPNKRCHVIYKYLIIPIKYLYCNNHIQLSKALYDLIVKKEKRN